MKDKSFFTFKKFKDIEAEEFNEINLDDFKKSQLNELKEKELPDFKNFLDNSNTDISIENLRTELNSDEAIKNVLKELEDIGLDGRAPLKLLKTLKI